MERYVIIPAGGIGQRMASAEGRPKQMMNLGGKPILRRTMELMYRLEPQVKIIVSMLPSLKEEWKKYCFEADFLQPHILADGGMTRFHSVKNALSYVSKGSLVAVHDAVRPFVTEDFVNGLFEAAQEHGAVVPSLPLVDSIRELKADGGSKAADRSRFVFVQTPQVFLSDILISAYEVPYQAFFTDDASVVEASGHPVTLVPGLKENFKITTTEDLSRAAEMLEKL